MSKRISQALERLWRRGQRPPGVSLHERARWRGVSREECALRSFSFLSSRRSSPLAVPHSSQFPSLPAFPSLTPLSSPLPPRPSPPSSPALQGKTFPLKRWQKELEKDQFRAIYYNAWEDDLCDDPLLSIIGKLSERFKKGNLETLAGEMGKIAIPLLKKNAVSTLTSTLQGTTIHTDFKRRRRQVCAAPD